MKLTSRLLSYLHRIFDKDPAPFLALRLSCDGTGMTWSVRDARLTTTPVGGTAQPLDVDLTQYSVASLANYLAVQPGYSVLYSDDSAYSVLGAGVLIDASGDVNTSNGDHLYAYTSVLWSYMEANARELDAAGRQIENMLLQMSTNTAEDVWLDELGGYYDVPRQQDEPDSVYGPRIIATVLRPLGNNVAIESALRVINAGLPATVSDYDQIVNGSYGLFDVDFEVSLEQLAVTAYVALILSIIETIDRMRDAGTFLRRLAIITRVKATLYVGGAVMIGDTSVVGLSDLLLDNPLLAEGATYGEPATEEAVDVLHTLLHSRLTTGDYLTGTDLEAEALASGSTVTESAVDALHTGLHATIPTSNYW
jgi:hypothetical protein